jgi:hypothetical protein
MTPICNKCGRPAFNIITCEVAIFSLDGSQNKRIVKFYLCDRHVFEPRTFTENSMLKNRSLRLLEFRMKECDYSLSKPTTWNDNFSGVTEFARYCCYFWYMACRMPFQFCPLPSLFIIHLYNHPKLYTFRLVVRVRLYKRIAAVFSFCGMIIHLHSLLQHKP